MERFKSFLFGANARNLVLLFAFVFIAPASWAMEICDNGIDDDGDGYIDCYDPDCSGFVGCDSAFINLPIPGCQYTPSGVNFSMSEKWRTDQTTVPMDNRQTPMVGDIDGDGIPEVIARQANQINSLYVFDGASGVVERVINSPQTDIFNDAVAIGDIDNDGFGEILLVADGTLNDRHLYCYEHTGVLKWRSNVPVGYAAADERLVPQIADFDGDGQAEIYTGNNIFNGASGILIASGGAGNSRGGVGAGYESFPIAVDVLDSIACPDCDGMELVAGNVVYSVNVVTGTMTIVRNMAPLGMTDGPTSIADIDLDGDLDAVVVANVAGRANLFLWDLQTPTLIASPFQVDLVSAAGANITTAGGQPNIADFNNDGTPEIGLAGRNIYAVFDLNTGPGPNTIVELWSNITIDASERTGSSVFDFEGDGANEVVYRDQDSLFVYDGTTGAVKTSVPCIAATRYDYPVVVDVDRDGQTDIVCSCNNQLVAFEAGAVPWVRARPIWNQHGYYVVNVNDDLSIPQVQQPHQLGWPQTGPVRYPFNAFLTQTTTLNVLGLPNYEAPDDSIGIASLTNHVDYGDCQDGINDSVGVRYTVYNEGDAVIPTGTPVSIYANNPFAVGSTYLTTVFTPANIPAGGSLLLPWTYVADQGGTFDLYGVVNDDGTGALPLTAPIFAHGECDFTNNTHELKIVDCGNNPPVVINLGLPIDTIFAVLPEGGPFTICVPTIDPDGDSVDVVRTLTNPAFGTVGALADGDTCFTFTSPINSSGQVVFQIEVCDNANVPLCDTVWVVIDVYLVNEAPLALADVALVPEDSMVAIDVQQNDSDPDNDPLTTSILTNPVFGTAVVLPNGAIQYTPNPNFNGLDSLVYIICDTATPPLCDTATVFINVNPVNDLPIAIDDTTFVPNDTASMVIQVVFNDIDIEGDASVLSITCGPVTGTAGVVGDSIVYSPDPTFIGLDSFCYILCDGSGCDTAVVYVNVTSGNLPPVGNNDMVTGTHFDPLVINALNNDTDPDNDPLDISAITCGPSNGTATIVGDSIVYQPNYGFLGLDTICYTVCDSPLAGPPLCDNAVIYIDILSDNNPPVLVDDSDTATHADPLTVTVTANDSDPDGDTLTVTAVGCGGPSNGVVTILNANQVVYTPNPGFLGQDMFCYVVCDNGFPAICDTAYVTITVISDNSAPIAVDDYPTASHNLPLVIFPTNNDLDLDNNNLIVWGTGCGPNHGTVSVSGNDSVIYTPDFGFLGLDTFCYVVCDDGIPSLCDTAFVYLTVIENNDPPIAQDETDSLEAGTTSVLTVTDNDYDPDSNNIAVSILLQPANGSALLNGEVVTYSPADGFAGIDSLQYALCDDGIPPMCDTATVFYYVYYDEFGAPIGFSPNGDGDNDTWVLDGLDIYPNHNLQIFNRWGKMVFETSDYENDWDGNFQGKPLPETSYFWVIDPRDGTDLVKGYVVIFR